MADPAVKAFIEKCIVKVSDRLSAEALLMDPFLQSDGDRESVHHFSQPKPHYPGKLLLFLYCSNTVYLIQITFFHVTRRRHF